MRFDPAKMAALRESCGISRATLAGELAVSEKTVYDWERGQSAPTFERGMRLARALRVHPGELLSEIAA